MKKKSILYSGIMQADYEIRLIFFHSDNLNKSDVVNQFLIIEIKYIYI